MRRSEFILLNMFVVGYPSLAMAQADPPANEVLDRYKDWAACAQSAAAALEPSAGTPEEIAIAAAERCQEQEVQYFAAEMFSPHPTPLEGVRAGIRDKIIAVVIEIRAARAKRHPH